MNNQDRALQMIDLFRAALKGHKQAFIETDGFDPEWPLWYADYLLEPLSRLLDANFTKSELVYLLVLVDKEQRLRAPGAEWSNYYAKFFDKRFGTLETRRLT